MLLAGRTFRNEESISLNISERIAGISINATLTIIELFKTKINRDVTNHFKSCYAAYTNSDVYFQFLFGRQDEFGRVCRINSRVGFKQA